MKLYLMRHTQTNYNVQGLLNDDPTVAVRLTETGLDQADKLAADLKDVPFQAIYTSTLTRTHQTADRINKNRGVQQISDVRLTDIRTGFEGQPLTAWWGALEADSEPWQTHFNGGESLEEVMDRSHEFLDDLERAGYETVLVVTHSIIVQMIHGLINKLPREEIRQFDIPQGSFIIEEL